MMPGGNDAPLVLGGARAAFGRRWQSPQGQRIFRNVDFVCDSDSESVLTLEGGFRFNGVRFVSRESVQWHITISGSLQAGVFYNETDNTFRYYGWGLSCVNESGNRVPDVTIDGGGESAIFAAMGRVTARGGSILKIEQGSFRDSDGSFPHGTICALDGAHIFTDIASSTGRFLVFSEGTQFDFVAEQNSVIEFDQTPTHEGSGGLMRARYCSVFKVGKNPIVTGSNAALAAQYGSQGRLTVDGATCGTATAGTGAALGEIVRPAGPWAVGDDVVIDSGSPMPKDISNIYRSQ